ncbi:O-antigen polysaccharide polymerase Wzy [Macellibacteroides fermentans]|uniref:O-antigen polysaccharide polymerase Wzy n=1 Tax=Macellibacteroides fermentans TaxID=879969 RepID=UPI00406C69F3
MTYSSKKGFIALLFIMLFLLFYVHDIRLIALINILSLAFGCYSIIKIQQSVISPFLIILVSMYIFHSGHLWVSLFKEDAEQFLLTCGYATGLQILLELYTQITSLLIVFTIIGICFIKGNKKSLDLSIVTVSPLFRSIVIILYFILMYYEILRSNNVAKLGYGVGYHYENDFALMLSDWVNILLIVVIFSYKDNPRMFWRYASLMIFRALYIMFMVGNRGESVINILILVFIITKYSYLSHNSKKLRSYILSIFCFLLFALPLVSLIRSGETIGTAFNNIGPIESFLMEFGDTARNYFMTNDYVSKMGPCYGMQMFSTSLTIFPGSTFLFGDVISRYGFVGAILNEYNNIKGLGGSNLSQLYFNFGNGYLLYVSTIILSFLTTWISNKLMTENNNIYKTIILLTVFIGLITNVRAEWYSVMSQLKIGLYLCFMLFVSNKSKLHFINSKSI